MVSSWFMNVDFGDVCDSICFLDLPGDDLAAPANLAVVISIHMWLERCNSLSLSPSLSDLYCV